MLLTLNRYGVSYEPIQALAVRPTVLILNYGLIPVLYYVLVLDKAEFLNLFA
uniref:Uncharacterized protein n=1 Tax=uncultured marine virus TaxID=186617 RepID=A0A0F7L0M1_9VIRU|nr:hypothetical protein [uncultured marine virus]